MIYGNAEVEEFLIPGLITMIAAQNYQKYWWFKQLDIIVYKNRLIPDDECIRKYKKIEIDAKLHLLC